MDRSDRDWEEFGRSDPYAAVLAYESRSAFFASGDEHVAALLRIIREQLPPGVEPLRALDFGCGVGRLLIPLAETFREVVGVDISESMRAETRRNCDERGLDNVELFPTLDPLVESGARFELVHTYIVLQHIRRDRGMPILSSLIDLVAFGGTGALHVQYAREAPAWRRRANWLRARVPVVRGLANVVQRRPWGSPLMEMHIYPIDEVMRMLESRQCHDVVIRFTIDAGGYRGAMVIFRKRARDLRRLD